MSMKRLGMGPRMSQAVIHNGIVYLSGFVGKPGDSVADQTRSILADVDKYLAEAGSDKHKILRAEIWLADMDDFNEMNSVWDAWVSKTPPARATSEARLAAPEYRVEIIVTAAC